MSDQIPLYPLRMIEYLWSPKNHVETIPKIMVVWCGAFGRWLGHVGWAFINEISAITKETSDSPGWCGSVDWALACKPKGHWFHSQLGHMPGWWAKCSVGGVWEVTTHWWFSPSLSPSFSLSLKINKLIKLKKNKRDLRELPHPSK